MSYLCISLVIQETVTAYTFLNRACIRRFENIKEYLTAGNTLSICWQVAADEQTIAGEGVVF